MVNVPTWASVFVTVTFTTPAACAAVVAVIDELLTTVTFVAAAPPRFTVAPARKFAPVMVTGVPPLAVPEVGLIEATLGAGAEVVVPSLVNFATDGTPLLFTKNTM